MSYPDYESDVLRTLSLQFNLRDLTGGPHPTAGRLREVLLSAVRHGHEVDALKRSVFYGSAYAGEGDGPAPNAALHVGESDDDGRHPSPDMIHSAMGIYTEAAELLEAVCASVFDGEAFDRVNAVEELGDLEWYMAVLRNRLQVAQEEVQRRNIAKLRARYPERFAREDALNRDLDRERRTLEEPGDTAG